MFSKKIGLAFLFLFLSLLGLGGSYWVAQAQPHIPQNVPSALELRAYLKDRAYPQEFTVQADGYLYYLIGSDFTILDTSDPVHPVQTGKLTIPQLDRGITKLTVANSVAYLNVELTATIFIVDVSDPTRPILLGTIDNAQHLAMVDNYLYTITATTCGIALECEQWRAYDMSVPSQPTAVYQTTFYGHSVYARVFMLIDNNRAFLFRDATYTQYDITNPTNPVQVGTLAGWDNYIYQALIDNNRLFLAGSDNLVVVDVSNPASPIATDMAYPDSYGGVSLTAVGNNEIWFSGMYGFFTHTGLWRYDATSLTQTNFYITTSYGADVILTPDNTYFVLSDELLTFPASAPDLNTPISTHPLNYPNSLQIIGDTAYSLNNSNTLSLIDLSDVAHPVDLSTLQPPTAITGDLNAMVIENQTLYALTHVETGLGGEDYLNLFDISDPNAPVELSSFLLGCCNGTLDDNALKIHNNFAYVSGGFHSVIDLSNPMTPTLAYTLTQSPQLGRISLQGNYLYLSSYDLRVYDISQPYSPTLVVTTTLTTDYVTDAQIHDSLLYVHIIGGTTDSLKLVDISNPTAPSVLADVPYDEYLSSFAVQDQILYMLSTYGSNGDTLAFWDISTPANPVLLGTLSTFDMQLNKIAVQGSYIYGLTSYLLDNSEIVAFQIPDFANPAITNLAASPMDGYTISTAVNQMVYVMGNGLYLFEHVLTGLEGQIADPNGLPVAGIPVALSGGETAVTDSAGHYQFTNLLTGTVTVTPTLANYVFAGQATFPITSGVLTANFIRLPQPVSANIPFPTDQPTKLAFTDAQGQLTHLNIPAGTVASADTFTLTPTAVQAPANAQPTGHSFQLTAVTAITFNQPVALTLHYSHNNLHQVLGEGGLRLYIQTAFGWQSLTAVCPAANPSLNTATNTLTANLCQPGHYALFSTHQQIYLPLIFKQ